MILVLRSFLQGLCLALSLCMLSACAPAGPRSYNVDYTVELQPLKDRAQVSIEIEPAGLLTQLKFTIDPEIHSEITANGELVIGAGQATWIPPPENARMSLVAKITHVRDDGEFDARMTPDWALFRGDDLVPPVAATAVRGATAKATLAVKLPASWTSVVTGWPSDRASNNGGNHSGRVRHFLIDNPERGFDRPTGWILAGKLGLRRNKVGASELIVGAPRGDSLRRMDRLVFLTLLWPQVEKAFGQVPEKLLVVGADDPMWRGGLSASNSLYLHSDRPLVSENGTSSLAHEVIHVVTRLRASGNDDWIVEGLAEFYSFELLYRAGGITANRRTRVLDGLADWGKAVTTLRTASSNGTTTARAAVLFAELDQEIRRRTGNAKTIDDVARRLMEAREVSLVELRDICTRLTGVELKVLQSRLLD